MLMWLLKPIRMLLSKGVRKFKMEYYGTSFWAPTNTLSHHGIKGQKWGVRHWQNSDGTFNEAGKKRYFGNGGGENYKPVRSSGGNVRRSLAKVYEANEKYYSKHGNNAMANANRQAKERLLKKASESDAKKEKRLADAKSAKDSKKIAKINKRLDSYQRDIDSFNAKTMADREKNRSKLEKKKKNAAEKVEDFDKGTKYVKAAQDRVNKVVSDYRDAKISAVKDKTFKQTDEYKKAIKSFNQLTRSGVPVSTLSYAFEAAADDVAKNK